ncbi:hypothetical protein H0H92_008023 [Tricholoma furcatifolium]|nr:hypothetical protein H0H92_008023 [Tricholoma furcatifolium]
MSRAATFYTIMDPATTKFLNARPYAVLPVSSHLAALYSTRSTPSPDWCQKCGSYLMNGGAEVRVVRLKSRKDRPSKRVMRTVCRSCRSRVDVAINNEAASTNVVHSDVSSQMPSLSTSLISPSPSPSPAPTVLPTSQESSAQAKQKNKKKSGLQLLLMKNREKELQESKSSPASGGLAAFLSGL